MPRSIELPPNSLKLVLAGEPSYSLIRQREKYERSQVSDAYTMLRDTVEPFMGNVMSLRRRYKFVGTEEVRNIRYATSRPVMIEDNTWIFRIKEDNLPGGMYSDYSIEAFDVQSKESIKSLYFANSMTIKMKRVALANQEEFDEFKKAVRFIGQQLIMPAART